MAERINQNFRTLAAGGLPFAAGMAAGLGPVKSGIGALTAIGIDKLLGPSAALAAIFLGISRTVLSIVRGTDLWAAGIERLARMENIESQFTTIFRSVDRAKEKMRELAQFSLGTPFRMDSVMEAARSMEVLTRGMFTGANALRMVGDVAAATNTSIEETSFHVGKLFSFLQSGRSIRNILFQMQSLGIITGELQNKLESLEDSGAGFAQKWAVVTSELSRAKGGMKDNMQTLDGLRTRLNNVRDAMAASFAQPFLNVEKQSILSTIKVLEAVSPALRLIAQDAALVRGVTSDVKIGLKGLAAEALATTGILGKMWQAFTVVAPAAILTAATHGLAMVGGAVSRRNAPWQLARQGRAQIRDINRGVRDAGDFQQARVAERVERMRDFRATRAGAGARNAFAAGAIFEAGAQGASFLFNRTLGVAARANASGLAALALASEKATAAAMKQGVATGALTAFVANATAGVRAKATATSLLGSAWGATTNVLRRAGGALVGLARFVLFAGGAVTQIARWGSVGLLVLWRLATNMGRAATAAEELSKKTEQAGKSMREMVSGIRTAEDRAIALAKAYEAVAEAQAAIKKTAPGTPERQEAETQLLQARSNVRIIQTIPEDELVPNEARTEENVSRRFFREVQLPLLEAEAIGQQGTASAALTSLDRQLEILREQAKYAKEVEEAQEKFASSPQGNRIAEISARMAAIDTQDPLVGDEEFASAEARLTAARAALAAAPAPKFDIEAAAQDRLVPVDPAVHASYLLLKNEVAAAADAVEHLNRVAKDDSPATEDKRKKLRDDELKALRAELRVAQSKSLVDVDRFTAQAESKEEFAKEESLRGPAGRERARELRQEAQELREQAQLENRKIQAGRAAEEGIARGEIERRETAVRAQLERAELTGRGERLQVPETNLGPVVAAQQRETRAESGARQAREELAQVQQIPDVEAKRVEQARLRVAEAEKELRIAREGVSLSRRAPEDASQVQQAQVDVDNAESAVRDAQRELAVISQIPGVDKARLDSAKLRVSESEKELRLAREGLSVATETAKQRERRAHEDQRSDEQRAQVDEALARGDTTTAGAIAQVENMAAREREVRDRLTGAFEQGGEPEVQRERQRIVQEEQARQRSQFAAETQARIQASGQAGNTDAPAAFRAFQLRQREHELIRAGTEPSAARDQAQREAGVSSLQAEVDASALNRIAGTFAPDEAALANVASLAFGVQRERTAQERAAAAAQALNPGGTWTGAGRMPDVGIINPSAATIPGGPQAAGTSATPVSGDKLATEAIAVLREISATLKQTDILKIK